MINEILCISHSYEYLSELVQGVVRVRRERSLREKHGAGEGAHDDRDDPPEHGLPQDGAVYTPSALQESNAGGGADLWCDLDRCRARLNAEYIYRRVAEGGDGWGFCCKLP